MNQFTWALAGILIVVIVGEVNPQIGGWLLLVIVVSMLFAAHERKDANNNPLL